MKVYTIYKVTNTVNGKCYVGYDSAWPRRQTSHLTAARSKKATTYKQPFHHAIKKYGEEAFVWEVVYQSQNQHHTLHEAEPLFIDLFNAHISRGGYNLTSGGEGQKNRPMSDETRHKKSLALKGKPSPQSRPVFTPKGTFSSIVEAAAVLNIHRRTLVHRINSPLIKDYGFVGSNKSTPVKRDGRKHVVITPLGKFASVKEAAANFNTHYSTIVDRCNSVNFPDWRFTGETG